MDGRDRRADQSDAVFFEDTTLGQTDGGVQRRLSTHGGEERIGPFAFDDLLDHVQRDRFDIRAVRKIRVGHDRRRIAVDQDHAVALFLEGLAGLRA